MIKENLQEVERRICEACKRSGRDRSEVQLIAVSKTKPGSMSEEAYAEGIRRFGENKPQELRDKYEEMEKDIKSVSYTHMKIVVIIFFTRFFMKHEEDLNKPQTILKAVGLVAIPWFFIYKQPDLSTSIVVLLLFCTIYFIAGLSSKIIGGMILICIPLVVIGAMLVTQPDQKILKGYQHDRIMGWLQPEKYPDISYQQTNSKIAIGSGQLYGKGLNNSDVNSVKNGNFIAEPDVYKRQLQRFLLSHFL